MKPNVDAGRLELRVRLVGNGRILELHGFCPFHHSAEPIPSYALQPCLTYLTRPKKTYSSVGFKNIFTITTTQSLRSVIFLSLP